MSEHHSTDNGADQGVDVTGNDVQAHGLDRAADFGVDGVDGLDAMDDNDVQAHMID
jgi:hypothetical protein